MRFYIDRYLLYYVNFDSLIHSIRKVKHHYTVYLPITWTIAQWPLLFTTPDASLKTNYTVFSGEYALVLIAAT